MKRTFNLLVLVTLLALTFGALGSSHASAATLVYSEDFESGYGNWSMSGLWNAESQAEACGSSKAPFPSPSNAVYYGTGSCNFNVGYTSGSLTMVAPVALPASGTTTLSFYSYEQTECGGDCGYDARYVELWNGSSWNFLGYLGTENTWYQPSFDISAYNGSNILLRFTFDSGDDFANSYFGWMVDSITITNSGAASDTTPPVVTVPSDITEEATSASGAVVTFSVSATDETSPANPAVSCDWPSGSTFSLGTTPVTCWATDDAMNTGYGYFNVNVVDTTDPLTTLDTYPPLLTNSTSATFTFHAEDAVSAPASITSYCDTGSGWNPCTSPVNLIGLSDGLHTIWIFSVDQAGNSEWAPVLNAVYSWTVDTTAPTFDYATSNPYEATGPGGANAVYTAGYTDTNGVASQSCSPASGSLFPIGLSPVTCSATDNAGNGTGNAFMIQVVDTTGPQLNLPADITVPQVTPAGAAVSFSVSATDLVSPLNPPVYCDWNSGDVFPVGTTTVHCSATDDYSNTSNGSFNVTVTATANLLQKSDFGGAYIFPFPWIPSGFRPPYGGALDCKIYVSGPCSVRFNASDRNLALAALQRVNRVGSAGDTISFGLYSRAQNVPNNGLYRVEITFFNGYRKLATYTVNFNAGTHDFELGTSMVNAPANYTRIDYRFVYQKVAGTAWFDDAFLYFVSAP